MESLEQALREGRTLAREGELEEAVKVFRKACEYYGRDPEPWYFLGAALFRQGEYGEAKRALMEVLSRQPNHQKAIELNNRIPRNAIPKPVATPHHKKEHRPPSRVGQLLVKLLLVLVVFCVAAAGGYYGVTYLLGEHSLRIEKEDAAKRPPQVTAGQFDRLKEGMTHTQVTNILGSEGVMQYADRANNKDFQVYAWTNVDGSKIVLTFSDGKLTKGDHFGFDGDSSQ